MAYREVAMVDVKEVLRLWMAGVARKRIAAQAGSIIITSNRGPDEWLATFADPMRAQSAIDRFTSNAYDLVLDGESYRQRLKPGRDRAQPTEESRPTKKK